MFALIAHLLGKRRPVTRLGAALLFYTGLALLGIGLWVGWNALSGWRTWPHVVATVVSVEMEMTLHGRQARPLVRFRTPGSGTEVTVSAKLGEDSPQVGEQYELAVNPTDPAENVTAKAAWILALVLPAAGLVLVIVTALWARSRDAAGLP
jgi:hypothetical protein